MPVSCADKDHAARLLYIGLPLFALGIGVFTAGAITRSQVLQSIGFAISTCTGFVWACGAGVQLTLFSIKQSQQLQTVVPSPIINPMVVSAKPAPVATCRTSSSTTTVTRSSSRYIGSRLPDGYTGSENEEEVTVLSRSQLDIAQSETQEA